MNPPAALDGAQVLKVAELSAVPRISPTRHVAAGREIADFAGVAIARYSDDPGFYLFSCDALWNVVTDTYHASLEAAVEQATFEFGSLSFRDVSSET